VARSETTAYRTERRKYVTQPVLFLRFEFVRKAGDGTGYAFSRDFSSGPVLSPTVEKITCVLQVTGNTQTADPVQGRSDIGVLQAALREEAGEITRYVADPARPLQTAIAASGTPSAIEVDDARGYPSAGHATIENEDFQYTATDITTTPHRLAGTITRPARGTAASAHGVGALVRNGEQIRRGARVTVFLGYAPLAEAAYGPGPGYTKLEVSGLSYNPQLRAWVVQASDIQRFVKRAIFENAAPLAPVTLGPSHPITLALQVLLSTGTQTNGPYDVLPKENGAAVPQALVDVAGLELLRSQLPAGLLLEFRESEPQDAKGWIEEQIFRPLNVVPFTTQDGKYSGRRFGTPLFARTLIVYPNVFQMVA
jgi:hypothetical protein